MQRISRASTEAPHLQLRDLMRVLNGYENETETEDFSQPQIKRHFADTYLLFVFVYSLLIISSALANVAMVFHIIKYDMHKDPTCAFLLNIVVANVIHVLFVLPFTLAVVLMRYWIFGEFFCYCLPILQDIPIHVSMMTYLLIACDRYRLLNDPRKPRIPAFVCALGTWFFAVCIALPHPIYTTYFDMRNLSDIDQDKRIHRLQLCISNLADDIREYVRSLFFGTYIAPLTITAYLYVKSGQELQRQEGPLAVAVFESRAKDSTSYSRQGSNTSNEIALSIHRKRGSESVGTSATAAFSNLSTSYDLDDYELDVQKEKRTQKYLIFMVTAYAVCLCPLMVLRLARSAFQETYDNSSHIDMTYALFVWVAFLPALITPCIYASWQMSRPAKERLRGYFRFSNRRHTRVREDEHHQQRRSSSRASRHHSSQLASPPLPPRSRTDSANSSSAVLGAASSVRSPKSSGVLPSDSPDLSIASYSPYRSGNLVVP